MREIKVKRKLENAFPMLGVEPVSPNHPNRRKKIKSKVTIASQIKSSI